jgi:hypothetical protein
MSLDTSWSISHPVVGSQSGLIVLVKSYILQ